MKEDDKILEESFEESVKELSRLFKEVFIMSFEPICIPILDFLSEQIEKVTRNA